MTGERHLLRELIQAGRHIAPQDFVIETFEGLEGCITDDQAVALYAGLLAYCKGLGRLAKERDGFSLSESFFGIERQMAMIRGRLAATKRANDKDSLQS